MSRRLAFGSILVLVAVAVLRIASVWDSLPPSMASHFAAGGQPNDWMGRGGFFAFYFGVVGLVTALLLGIGGLMRVLPDHLLNLPHREHWLAPERREGTLERIARAFRVYAFTTVLFSAAVLELVLRANLEGRGLANGPFFVMLVAYLAFTGIWTIQFTRAFAQPEAG